MMKEMIYGVVSPRVEHPTLVEKENVKPYSKNDMVHMMLELEYVLQLLPNLGTYYLLHYFQICLRVGVALPILGGHITKKQLLAMWVVKDLEWKEFLAYNIIPSIKRILSVIVRGGLPRALCLEVLLQARICLLGVLSLTPNCCLQQTNFCYDANGNYFKSCGKSSSCQT